MSWLSAYAISLGIVCGSMALYGVVRPRHLATHPRASGACLRVGWVVGLGAWAWGLAYLMHQRPLGWVTGVVLAANLAMTIYFASGPTW